MKSNLLHHEWPNAADAAARARTVRTWETIALILLACAACYSAGYFYGVSHSGLFLPGEHPAPASASP